MNNFNTIAYSDFDKVAIHAGTIIKIENFPRAIKKPFKFRQILKSLASYKLHHK